MDKKANNFKIAIMQPTFIPWVGYFAMIDSVDEFVILDSVQFAKRSWQQRNRIKTSQGELMTSVPVFNKGKSDQLIFEVDINKEDSSFKKIKTTIKSNYTKAPYFNEYSEEFFSFFEEDKLVNLNVNIIKLCMRKLSIPLEKLSFSHDLTVDTKKAELLSDICELKNANIYLSAPGSRAYIEESGIFNKKNIEVIYHNYSHPKYKQQYGEFIPYMGIIDLLFNEGPKSREIMLSGLEEKK